MDIRLGKSKVATLVPSSPMTGAATGVIYDDQGEALATGLTVTPSAVSTTVADAPTNTRSSFEVASGAGVEPGLFVVVSDPQWGSAVSEVSAVSDDIVRLVDPLPDIPDVGATVVGLDVLVTIPSSVTGAIGNGYVLEVTEGDESAHLEFAVVRYPFRGPCTAREVRASIARQWQGEYLSDERFHERVAADVNALVRSHLLAAGEFISRYWDPAAFASAVPPLIRLVLAERHGLREGGATREEYIAQERGEAEARLKDVVKSVRTRDKNMDGKLNSEEKDASKRYSIELVQ